MRHGKNRIPRRSMQNIGFMLRHLWNCSPSRVITSFVTVLFGSVVEIAVSVYLFRYIINGIQAGYSFGRLLLVTSAVMGTVMLMLFFLDWYNNVYIPRSDLKISKYFDTLLFQKTHQIDLEYFDKAEFYDQYTRAIQEASRRAIGVLNDLSSLFSAGTVLVGLGAILLSMDPVLIAFAFAPVVLSLPLSVLRNKLNFKFQQETTPDNRKMDYCKRVLYQKEYAKEIKMTNIFPVILSKYNTANENLSNLATKFGVRRTGVGIWETFNQVAVVMYATYVYLIYSITVSKTLMIGDFVALYNAVRNAEYSLRRIIEIVPRLNEHSLFIQNVRDFLDLQPRIQDPEHPLAISGGDGSLDLQTIQFQYDDHSHAVLQDICMRIEQNQKIAIVGRNGAGKTTLVKTIMRLYEPKQGCVYFGGEDYRNYSLEEYHALFGTVFQDFALYHISVAENVAMDFVTKENEPRIREVLKKVGLYDKIMAEGKDIYNDVSKEFSEDGIVFSGGEEQKIAIARAFGHPNKILIFDEASSALDPISEYEMNHMILEMAKDKTVILISHRLSSTRDADRIYYLEHGQICEEGTHEELMDMKGGYAKMFSLQAEQYLGKERVAVSV